MLSHRKEITRQDLSLSENQFLEKASKMDKLLEIVLRRKGKTHYQYQEPKKEHNYQCHLQHYMWKHTTGTLFQR